MPAMSRPSPLCHFLRACLFSIAALCLLSACGTSPTPVSDGPILTNGQALPKVLVTIALSPTPDTLSVSPTVTATVITSTPAPATVTPTGTPLIGIFLGDQTRAPLDGTFTWLPTRTARLTILTAVPGAHPTAAPVAFNSSQTAGGAFSAGTGSFLPLPIVLPPAGTPHPCSVAVASNFVSAYNRSAVASAHLGCPTAAGYSLRLVSESFQSGVMFWRESKDIYALSTLNLSRGTPQDLYWHTPDTWTDSIPASDPTLNPPPGTSQPVRGFGYVWRSNPAIRNSLGWALDSEQSYNGFWQDFEHGFMLSSNVGTVYALTPLDPSGTTGVHYGALTP